MTEHTIETQETERNGALKNVLRRLDALGSPSTRKRVGVAGRIAAATGIALASIGQYCQRPSENQAVPSQITQIETGLLPQRPYHTIEDYSGAHNEAAEALQKALSNLPNQSKAESFSAPVWEIKIADNK